jgi:hypothetical protein
VTNKVLAKKNIPPEMEWKRLAEMPAHQEWHDHWCCDERHHKQYEEPTLVQFSQEELIDLDIPLKFAEVVSPQLLIDIAAENSTKPTGGALFSQSKRWIQCMPGTQSARWQEVRGAPPYRGKGVTWRLRPVPQQGPFYRLARTEEEKETTWARLQELMTEGAYEEVQVTEEEERRVRRLTRRMRKERGPCLLSVKDLMEVPSLSKASRCSPTHKLRIDFQNDKNCRKRSRESESILNGIHCGKDFSQSSSKKLSDEGESRDKRSTRPEDMLVAQIFYSPLITIAKTSDPTKTRLLQEQKSSGANLHTRPPKHKQDTLTTLQGMIRPGDLFLLWDLKDMFHQVLNHPTMRPMVRAMVWKQVRKHVWTMLRVQARTCSQGSAPSPGLGTKMLADPKRKLASHGIRMNIKVDDIFVSSTGYNRSMRDRFLTTKFLVLLGAKFSAKNQLRPSHRAVWNGANICSVAMVMSQPAPKVLKMVEKAMLLRHELDREDGRVSVKLIQQVKGVLKASLEQVDGARIMTCEMQELERWLDRHSMEDTQWHVVGTIPWQVRGPALRECLEWVRDFDSSDPIHAHWNGKLFVREQPLAIVYSDACNYQKGWRVAADQKLGHPEIKVRAPMTEEEMDEHITVQETDAANDALLDVMRKRDYRMGLIMSMTDATTTEKYVGSFGGRKRNTHQRHKAVPPGGAQAVLPNNFGPCEGQDQSIGRGQQSAGGLGRMELTPTAISTPRHEVGATSAGRIRSSVEQPVRPLLHDTALRQCGAGSGCDSAELGRGERSDICVSANGQEGSSEVATASAVREPGNGAIVATGADGGTVTCFTVLRGRSSSVSAFGGAIVSADGIWTTQGRLVPSIEVGELECADWRAFVRTNQQAQGFSHRLVEGLSHVYKRRQSGAEGGGHHASKFALFCAYLRETVATTQTGERFRIRIDDVVLGNVAGMSAYSERRAEGMLSSLRVVFGKAFGKSSPELTYRDEVTTQVKALGKSCKAAAPKYTKPVDILPFWKYVMAQSPTWEKQTIKQRYNAKRNATLYALRHDRVNRSDDEAKWDPRSKSYMRCYNAKGELIEQLPLVESLAIVIDEDGFVEVNYRDPKDPRKIGVWSDTVTHRPLRVGLMLRTGGGHLTTEEEVKSICAVRMLKSLVQDMQQLEMLGEFVEGSYKQTKSSVPERSFWASKHINPITNRFLALQASSLGTIVRKLTAELEIGKVSGSEEPGAGEQSQLAGHFLRGHVGSIAYDFASKKGAAWEPTEGIDRARHTMSSFFASYYRGVSPRISIAFDAVARDVRSQLRLEEATRL